MWQGQASPYPRQANTLLSAVPNVTMTAVTTVDTAVQQLVFSNTTGSTITVTVEDTQASPKAAFFQINILANAPCILPFDPPMLFVGGVQWQASATGLVGAIQAQRKTGWTLVSGTTFCNNTSS